MIDYTFPTIEMLAHRLTDLPAIATTLLLCELTSSESKREKDREADRQTNKDSDRDGETEKETDRQTEREKDPMY